MTTKKEKTKKIFAKSYIYLMLLIIYLPILLLAIYSFTASKVMGVWTGFTFKLYADLVQDSSIMTAVANTLIVGLASSILATFIGTISAIGINHLRKTPKMLVNTASQITVINADIVTGVAFMLLFVTIQNIGLPLKDGFVTLIIAHTVITIPFVILSVLPRLNQLNPNLYEAGLDLGASPFKALWLVIVPQLIPGMISGFALAFTLSLDDFVITKFNNGEVETISTLIYNSTKHGIQPAFRALSTIIFTIILVVLVAVNVFTRKKNKSSK